MILHLPDYYEQFRCIADKCSDSCCRGWKRIEIDENTYNRYKNLDDEYSKEILSQIKIINGQYFFKLKYGYCPFLNQDNLCDIYINEGEDMLCTTCSTYPRFIYSLQDDTYGLLTMSCPVVADMIIGADESVTYYIHKDNEKKKEIFPAIKFLEENNEILWKKMIVLIISPCDDELLYDEKFVNEVYASVSKYKNDTYIRAEIVEEFANIFYTFTSKKPGFEKIRTLIENNILRAPKSYEKSIEKIKEAFEKYNKYVASNNAHQIEKEIKNFICYELYRGIAAGYKEEEYIANLFTIVAAATTIYILQAFEWLDKGEVSYDTRIGMFQSYSKIFEHSDKMRKKLWDKFIEQGYVSLGGIVSMLMP